MPSDFAREIADAKRGLVIAPAGCGKTHLIADAVSHSRSRQLILTHTHAGVRAILDHLRRRGVPSSDYRVSTIDGLALHYASAFPSLSGWKISHPTKSEEWRELRIAAIQAFKKRTVRRVLDCSYTGIFVDEYQDCTAGQHALITLLAELLPCRIMGDPMQSVFWSINKGDQEAWKNVVTTFPKVGELQTPHRWNEKHDELGNWLLQVRQKLENGEPVDLRTGPVEWHDSADQPKQLNICYSALSQLKNQSVVAIRGFRQQCYRLARSLRGSFRTMEQGDCAMLGNLA